MEWHPCCIRIWSTTPKQSSDLTIKFVNVWLALVVKRRTKLQITHGSTLETNLEMKDLPPCGRTTTLKTSNIISSLASSAGRSKGARTHLSSWSGRQGGLNRRAHGVVRGAGHRSTLAAARALPWSPPAGELHNTSRSISLPQVPKKMSSTNLKEHVMVSSITVVTEHVMLT
jgi:hypothetical protein